MEHVIGAAARMHPPALLLLLFFLIIFFYFPSPLFQLHTFSPSSVFCLLGFSSRRFPPLNPWHTNCCNHRRKTQTSAEESNQNITLSTFYLEEDKSDGEKSDCMRFHVQSDFLCRNSTSLLAILVALYTIKFYRQLYLLFSKFLEVKF